MSQEQQPQKNIEDLRTELHTIYMKLLEARGDINHLSCNTKEYNCLFTKEEEQIQIELNKSWDSIRLVMRRIDRIRKGLSVA